MTEMGSSFYLITVYMPLGDPRGVADWACADSNPPCIPARATSLAYVWLQVSFLMLLPLLFCKMEGNLLVTKSNFLVLQVQQPKSQKQK